MYFWSLTYVILASVLSGKLLKHMEPMLCVLKMAQLISLHLGLFQIGKSCQEDYLIDSISWHLRNWRQDLKFKISMHAPALTIYSAM